jgi:branched-chain amino acid transport system ATP-binding protein
MEILKVDKLALNFGGLQVLQEIDFSLQAGEKVALIGPNGAGKTTVLNVISGLLVPLAGQITLKGRDITHLSTHARAALGLARSFQTSSLYPALTIISNVLLALHGIKKSSYQMFRPLYGYKDEITRANDLLASVELMDKRDLLPTSLSHGEQRRLELILALATHPSILLLDEPTAGLTSGESSALAQMLRSPANKDIAVLFVAHDLDLVFEVAERILVLYYGRIIAEGTPKEIQNNQKVKEIYLGESAGART